MQLKQNKVGISGKKFCFRYATYVATKQNITGSVLNMQQVFPIYEEGE